MAQVTFVASDGQRYEVDASEGLSLMECARRANVPGIVAECGGACACATCHIYVGEGWGDSVGSADAMEKDMLEFADAVQSNSRLSCQIKIAAHLDGLMVHLPAGQG
jgi:2Fe-2S ferredoxin